MGNAKTICVYCGSSAGAREEYRDAAREFGKSLAERGYRLVYGGGHIGLMGIVADAVLACGGEAIGVIPQWLVDREVAHRGLTKLHVVETMHQRKQMMADMADAFVALPGGYGTLDELCEVLGWAQLGLHSKPIVLFDVAGYWQPLFATLNQAVAEGFLRQNNRDFAMRAESVEEIFTILHRAWQTA
jgi:uncharacterized protein (TIGR00730 family)